MNQTAKLRLGTHANGQTAIFDNVGLVCTMEAGSQSKRDTDAVYIIALEKMLKYAAHKFDCAKVCASHAGFRSGACSCGFDEAVSKVLT